ncbi:MAG TPA: hypothetical protein VK743_15300 [Steroidobacteraceae bacterium]|jgi:hypothetical protein|nr:hypothetical protein [Steroidobacteraceae bacterium]
MSDADPVGKYCDYLDKEMTIMGLLTAFSVAVPALVLDRVAGAKEPESTFLSWIWRDEQLMLCAGSLALFFAALAFYLQRSHLAFYYGQLRLSCTEARYPGLTSKSLLLEVDSWAAWVRYNLAFVLLLLGFAAYGVVLFAPALAKGHSVLILCSVGIPALIYTSLNWYVKRKYLFEDHPWRKFFAVRRP